MKLISAKRVIDKQREYRIIAAKEAKALYDASDGEAKG